MDPFEQALMILATDLMEERINFAQFLVELKQIFTFHGWKAPDGKSL